MSVSSELVADPDAQDKQPAAMDKNDSGSPVASPKASPKSILRKRTINGEMGPRRHGRKTSVVAFANELGGDLAGAQISEKARSRDDWLWSVNKRRAASMIDLFRAKETAEKSLEDDTRSVEGKYRDAIWDVVLFETAGDSDDDSSDDDENDEAEDAGEYDENDEEMDGEGIEIVFEAWIDEDADHRTWAEEGNDDEEMDDSSSIDDDDDDNRDDEESEIEDGDDMTMTPSSSPSYEKSLMLEPH